MVASKMGKGKGRRDVVLDSGEHFGRRQVYGPYQITIEEGTNIPTPKNLPTTQQINAVLGSVISGSQTLLSMDMKHYVDLRASFLKFYSHPTFQLLLGLLPQNTPTAPPVDSQLNAELKELKSTITALLVTVASLKPKAKEMKASTP